MPSRDLERKITDELKEIKQKWSYHSEEDAFVHWCLRLASNSDDDDQCNESFTNRANDLGIDGIMIIEGDPNIIHFVQAKYTIAKSKVERSDVKEFVDNVVKVLRDPKFSLTGNNDIMRLSRDARDLLRDAPDTNITLSYFNYGKFAPNALNEINDWKRKFKQESDFVKSFNLQAFDRDAVIEKYRLNSATSDLPPDITLPILDGQVFETKRSVNIDGSKKDVRSVIFTTKGSEIGDIRNKHGRSVFSINVRYSLGTTNKVNEAMMKTLKDSKENDKFWFYNNGIYATCDSFEVSNDEKSVKINGIQIVNGCQTSTVFGEALNDGLNLSDVDILIRLVEERKDKIIANISRYTNTQNAVKARDLHSNDPIQDTIFDIFQKRDFFGEKYFYERKVGEWQHFSNTKKFMTRGRTKVDNKQIAQAFLAFAKLKAARAKASADLLFRDNYSEIFDEKKTEASHLFYPWYVSRMVNDFVNEQKIVSGQEYLSQSHSTLIAFLGHCFRRKFAADNIERLTEEFEKMNKENFEKHIKHYLNFGIKALNLTAIAKNGGKIPDQNFDARRFFLDQELLEKGVIPNLTNIIMNEKEFLNPPKV